MLAIRFSRHRNARRTRISGVMSPERVRRKEFCNGQLTATGTSKRTGQEISSHRKEYVESITKVRGVKLARPLTEKGMYVRSEKQGSTRELFSAWEEMKDQVLDEMGILKKKLSSSL